MRAQILLTIRLLNWTLYCIAV